MVDRVYDYVVSVCSILIIYDAQHFRFIFCYVLKQKYSQEEIDNVVVIKVTDTEYNRYTYLTVAKFEERLADMRCV